MDTASHCGVFPQPALMGALLNRSPPPTPLVLPSEAWSSGVPGSAAGSGPNLPWAPLLPLHSMHLPAKQDYHSLLPRNALHPPPPYFQHTFLDQLLWEPSSSILCLCLCDPKVLDVRPTDPEQALSPAVGKRRHQPFKGHCDITLDSQQPPKYPPRPPSSAFLTPHHHPGRQCQA